LPTPLAILCQQHGSSAGHALHASGSAATDGKLLTTAARYPGARQQLSRLAFEVLLHRSIKCELHRNTCFLSMR